MTGNHENISAHVAAHVGEVMIYNTKLYRLIRFEDALDDDYYYEAIDVRGVRALLSCVGGCIWLKGVIPDKDYDQIDTSFRLTKEFLDELTKETMEKI